MTDDIYRRLGVRPFINAFGVRTINGGGLWLETVRESVAEASRYNVSMPELMAGIGERLAELTGAESALVTSGSASALYACAAACIAGNDPEKMLRLPDAADLNADIIMVRGQRFAYDQALRMAGARIVEVGSREELLEALYGPVAMVCVLGMGDGNAPLRLTEIAEMVKALGIPILVDAAAEHLKRPNPWLAAGADMVTYSGGKFLRAPQTTGLLLGKASLLKAAFRNTSPFQSLGRPMKVGKEDAMGLLAAVEYWFARDEAAELQRWYGLLEQLQARLSAVPALHFAIQQPQGSIEVPTLNVSWDPAIVPIDGEGLRQLLLAGEPRVMLDDLGVTASSVRIDPFGLELDDIDPLADAIAAALAALPPPQPKVAPRPASADVAGPWEVELTFLHTRSGHRLSLAVDGNTIRGTHYGRFFETPLDGEIDGDAIILRSRPPYAGRNLSYRFEGRITGDTMRGTVVTGTSTARYAGNINMTQFGEADWTATRPAGDRA